MKQKICLLFFLFVCGASFSASVCFYYNANTIYDHPLTNAITYMNVYGKDKKGYDILIGWTQLPAGDAAAGCMPVNYDATEYPHVRVEMGLRVYGNAVEFDNITSGARFSVDKEGGFGCDSEVDCHYHTPTFTVHQAWAPITPPQHSV